MYSMNCKHMFSIIRTSPFLIVYSYHDVVKIGISQWKTCVSSTVCHILVLMSVRISAHAPTCWSDDHILVKPVALWTTCKKLGVDNLLKNMHSG